MVDVEVKGGEERVMELKDKVVEVKDEVVGAKDKVMEVEVKEG